MKKVCTILVVLCLFHLSRAQGEGEIQPQNLEVTDSTGLASQTSETEADELNDTLKKLKELIDESNSGSTEIGTFRIQPYAIVFPGHFPVSKPYQVALLRRRIDSVNKTLELRGKAASRVNFTLKKAVKDRKSGDEVLSEGTTVELHIAYIDSVKVAISEGVIEHLKVYTSDGNSFYNTKSPIPILTIEKRFDDRLFNPQNGNFILLKDALYFEADRRFNYFPDAQELTIKNTRTDSGIKTGSQKLYAENGLNALVNLQVYSDLLGVFGDEPNGLIQFEANTKLYLHRANYKNTYTFMPFDAIEPFFHFNRIESKFDTIALSSAQEINRLELFRRYTYAVGLDVNLFRGDWRPSNSFELKAGYMYSSSNLVIDDEKLNAALHTPYLEAVLKSRKLNNFGIDLRVRHAWQKLNPNTYIENDEWNDLLSFRAGVSYFPDKKKTDKIFLRFINYLNLSDRKQDFALLQLGFSKAISFN
ncbi:hypothetical protein ED312_19350 [Sinomicrobium pectinilyticum]|uniref:DUF3570 domain-containing protein n=1 Tax=Sinomicrobium pectinilyticum TaxID=1084421 RepID=A0A3N0DRS8_SINP1|nr:hypothetical protein [Sinomicrobium pectinilyticum]RNL78221.1 hypothetical protein ED312_19350 [Sinomicrobium pectinilyticum]